MPLLDWKETLTDDPVLLFAYGVITGLAIAAIIIMIVG